MGVSGRSAGVAGPVQATAAVAAACRAEESRQPRPRLVDPYAAALTAGLDAAGQALLAGGRDEVVHRTLLVDALVGQAARRRPGLTVLNLGAGLCTRPYRLDLAGCREVVEVDAAAVLERKAAILRGARATCPVRRVAADVRDLPALGAAAPVLVVTEGLLVYLEPADLAALAATLAGLAGVVGWVTDVVSAESAAAMAQLASRAGAGIGLTGLSTLDPIERAGWTVTDYRVLPVTRAPRPAAPGSGPASARVVDGVLALRPAG
ncbi:MAG TPA: class I SAM-dependent methyltransferase [Pilimelia sp.]|nr:class I SAM-dependent methyltransferase [Pilimelia sp.]